MDVVEGDRHELALALVRDGYEVVAGIRGVSLAQINRVRPMPMRYATIEEAQREFLAAAGAVSTFAVNLRLISPDEALQILRDFHASHPELGL